MNTYRYGLCVIIMSLFIALCIGPSAAAAERLTTDSSSLRTTTLGIRMGTDVGAPAIHVERSIRPLTTWFIALGAERALVGNQVQVGLRQYFVERGRGFYVQVAGAVGHGATGRATWGSMGLSGAVGYAWPVRSPWTVTMELGGGGELFAAEDRFGASAISRNTGMHVGVGLLWW